MISDGWSNANELDVGEETGEKSNEWMEMVRWVYIMHVVEV